ncbi:MAG: hypothetical protein MR361_08875 [Clostridiales bacterium]|nr:hypothetical protein [Clostridiales bacterium]
MDGKLIYQYSTKGKRWFGKTSPECYLMIPVTAADAGKVLRLELVSDNGILYQSYVGSEYGVWKFLINLYFAEIIVAAIVFLIGILTILFSAIYGILNKRSMDIIYLGYACMLSAVWLDMNSIFRQIMFRNVSIASEIPFYMVMLIPFSVIIYMNEIQGHRFEKFRSVCLKLMNIMRTVNGLIGILSANQ